MPTLTESTGRRTLDHLDYVGGLSIQWWASVRALGASLPFAGNRYRWKAGERGTGGVSGDARKLLANLNAVTGPANQQQIQALLGQANGLLASERPKIDHLTDQVQALTQHADVMIGKTGRLIDHADGAIQNVNTTVSDVRQPVLTDLTDLQSTLNQARALLANMQVVVNANDDKIEDTMDNLRVATDNLDQLTDTLKQRPWSLIRTTQPQERKVPQ